jgi:hypothetical protein
LVIFLKIGGYGEDWTNAPTLPAYASGYGKTDFEGYVNINNCCSV